MSIKLNIQRFLGALFIVMAAGLFAQTFAKDYLVTISKPNSLFVIDPENKKVTNECKMEGQANPGIFVMSPDNKIAYILNGRWEDIYGVDIDSCEVVFKAQQSTKDIRSKTIASITVSKDGKELYTVRNRTRIHSDHYEVLEPELAVYETSAGLDAQPIRTFPAQRRMTVMATESSGNILVAGHDIVSIDPKTGDTTVKIANASWDRPTYSSPDVLAFWPIGTQNDEFLLLYTAAVFTDEKHTEMADYVWGYQSVNLTTGETEIADFASLEVLMFSAVRGANSSKDLYGVYTQLSHHDISNSSLVKRVDLPHTYYCINISTDGKTLYVGGTQDDIGIYDAETLERKGEVILPTGGDMGVSTLHVIQRES